MTRQFYLIYLLLEVKNKKKSNIHAKHTEIVMSIATGLGSPKEI